jgi:chromosome partitioning protein
MGMPRVIAIMNQKGGVGKTTTTLNLGAALACKGKRVLLVDLDPQANLTLGAGKRAKDLSESVYELLTDPKADASRLVVKTNWDNLHLVPSHIDLSGAEIEMVTMIGREARLTKSLDPVRAQYDYIFIDCLPSLSLLTVNAMAAATEVFVPLQAHPFALEGLGKLFEVVGMIREAMNPALRVSGVLVTMFDGRTNVSKETLDTLRRDDRLREHIFTTTIKQNIKVAESQREGVPVIHFDASCHASKAYLALCEEVLEMESGCLASQCAERITAREEKAGAKITFTPDLIAPATRSSANGADEEQQAVPATPKIHVAPVSALVGENATADAAAKVAEPDAGDQSPHPVSPSLEGRGAARSAEEIVVAPREPLPRLQYRNDPASETLHPSTAPMAPLVQSVAVPVAAPPKVSIVDPEGEYPRPRLKLKPAVPRV